MRDSSQRRLCRMGYRERVRWWTRYEHSRQEGVGEITEELPVYFHFQGCDEGGKEVQSILWETGEGWGSKREAGVGDAP